MTYFYSCAVPSEIASVCATVREQIANMREQCALDSEQLMDLRLILSELMINGCEHGNHNDHGKRVHLRLMVTDTLIHIRVRDEGSGFELNLETNEKNHLDCGGRGLRIVAKLVDEMNVKRNEVHCVLRRTRRLSPKH